MTALQASETIALQQLEQANAKVHTLYYDGH